MKFTHFKLWAMLLVTAALGACKQDQPATKPTESSPKASPSAATAPSVPSREERALLSVTATIEAIDRANREVTLKGPMGRSETFAVSKDVKRFDEALKGPAPAK